MMAGVLIGPGQGQALAAACVNSTGTAWQQVPSPNPGQSVLSGVAATSSANIWAVGNYVSSSGNKTVTLHCC